MIPASSGWLLTLANCYASRRQLKGGSEERGYKELALIQNQGLAIKMHKEEGNQMLKLTINSLETRAQGYL